MSIPDTPALSDEMIDTLLQQEEVKELMVQVLSENGLDASLEELPYEARADLLKALFADGIIEFGPPQELSAEEFAEILEAEEAASETKERDRSGG